MREHKLRRVVNWHGVTRQKDINHSLGVNYFGALIYGSVITKIC
jgi:hypothetical protein